MAFAALLKRPAGISGNERRGARRNLAETSCRRVPGRMPAFDQWVLVLVEVLVPPLSEDPATTAPITAAAPTPTTIWVATEPLAAEEALAVEPAATPLSSASTAETLKAAARSRHTPEDFLIALSPVLE